MWNGYLQYGGNEVINVERTARYALNDGAHWFIDTFKSTTLHSVLGDEVYRSPLQDSDASWVDPDTPDTYGFYGCYPIDITGVDDSTRTSAITENTGDGGNAGRLRHGTRQMVFSLLLLGESDAAVDAGFAWLKAVLLPSNCEESDCEGSDLCFFAAEPQFEEGVAGCGDEYLRTIQRVTINNGPTITARNTLRNGSAVWTVQFTAVANIPWHFGLPINLVTTFPWRESRGGVYADGTEPNLSTDIFTEVACQAKSYVPVFDPACPDLVLPPVVPPVKIGCYTPPKNWKRYSFKIPAETVRVWTDLVPLISVHTGTRYLRNMRIRIYQDPNGTFDPDLHPCRFCVDFLVSYQPENSTMVIDGRDQTVVVLTPGQARRADGLVFDTNDMPFTWPSLSCGIGYVVTVDFLQTQWASGSTPFSARPKVDFSLVPRIK